jgi:hypothetical protein
MQSKNPGAGRSRLANRKSSRRRPANRYGRYGVVNESTDHLIVTFNFPEKLTLGLRQRAREARRRTLKLLRRINPTTIEKGDSYLSAAFPLDAADRVAATLKLVDHELDGLMVERLHPALVEQILGITARERLRWTKDGRLRSSGHGSFSRGSRSINYALYRPAEISKLARAPHIIENWRAADSTCARS